MFEANQQWKRDKIVDNAILSILRQRFEDCVLYEAPDHTTRCQPLLDTYNKASENWFIKCKLREKVESWRGLDLCGVSEETAEDPGGSKP
jgi:hypothetical protein